jgi:hypothetical protein
MWLPRGRDFGLVTLVVACDARILVEHKSIKQDGNLPNLQPATHVATKCFEGPALPGRFHETIGLGRRKALEPAMALG